MCVRVPRGHSFSCSHGFFGSYITSFGSFPTVPCEQFLCILFFFVKESDMMFHPCVSSSPVRCLLMFIARQISPMPPRPQEYIPAETCCPFDCLLFFCFYQLSISPLHSVRSNVHRTPHRLGFGNRLLSIKTIYTLKAI